MDFQQRKVFITPKPSFPRNEDYRKVEETLNPYFKSEESIGYIVDTIVPIDNCWIWFLKFDYKTWLRKKSLRDAKNTPKLVEYDEEYEYDRAMLN